LTGQLIEEKMAVYVRLGMRLLYRGSKNTVQSKRAQRILENMSIKQGKRFNAPESAEDIPAFIKFHKLDMSEVLDPVDSFKTFNEFFYRKLKPEARPCDSAEDANVAVSAADCRMMTFATIDDATKIWIKGLEFSVGKLLGDEELGKTYNGGALAIFRLAPQDYHR
jgi:phosphatidylserine decarboxylase